MAHTVLFLHLCRTSSCVTALYLLNSGLAPSTELFLFICANICFAQLVVQWKPNILCSTAAASVCAGSDQTWLGGGQGHPWCPLGVRAGQHQRCFPVLPELSQPNPGTASASGAAEGSHAGVELGLSGSPRSEGESLKLPFGVYV